MCTSKKTLIVLRQDLFNTWLEKYFGNSILWCDQKASMDACFENPA